MAQDVSVISEEVADLSELLSRIGAPVPSPEAPPEAEAGDSPDASDSDPKGGALLAAAGWLADAAGPAASTAPADAEDSLSDLLAAAEDRIAGDPAFGLAGAGDRDENGSADTITTVLASGDQGINGLLRGVRWGDGYITYSDPDSTADYQAGYGELLSNFQQVNADQMLAVHFALNSVAYTQSTSAAGFSVEGFTGLTIDYAGAGSGSGTIRVANTSNPGTAYAYYPANSLEGGDAFFGGSGRTPQMGNYHWHTVLHELGHSLGLQHGHEAGSFGAMPANLDSMEYSLMTYRSYVGAALTGYTNEQFGYAQTYMMYDIAALQYMYGADYTTNGGDTVYSWNPASGNTVINGVAAITPGGNRIFLTIWDGGGTDTYDLSAYTTNLTIDLAPGSHSIFSTTQLADLDQFSSDPARIARGNVFNALLYQNNLASLIENAIGGSGNDLINGNQGVNVLTGGAGNDTLNGLSDIDTLYGGAGNDVLDGGLYGDTSYGEDGNDLFLIRGYDLADNVYGGNGFDTLDLSNYTNTSLGFQVDLTAGSYDFIPDPYGPYVVNSIEIVIGSARNDILLGAAAAETLVGGLGNDTLEGRAANDYLYGNDGTDRLLGGGGNDILNGAGGADEMYGNVGNDTMNGGAGLDTLVGGLGDDSYSFVTDVDVISEVAGGGIDTLYTSLTCTLAAEVENLVLSGVANLNASGNILANVMTGNAGNNRLAGAAGNDRLIGAGGNDVLVGGGNNDRLGGGGGADVFVFAGPFGVDRVLDFGIAVANEVIDLSLVSAITSFADLVANHLTNVAGNAVISVGANSITLAGVSAGSLSNDDFLF